MDQLRARRLRWFSNKALYCVVLSLVFFHLGCVNNASQMNDSLYITESEYDFGIVPDSINDVKHSFYIINNSADTCKIENIEKSCGCTDIRIIDMQINPHDSIMFEVVLNVGSNYSFMERNVNFYFENKEQPLTLYLRATRNVPQFLVKKEFPFKLSENFSLSGYSALLGYVQQGQEKNVSLNIINTSNRVRHLKLISKVPEGFDVFYPSTIQAQEISRIVICCNIKEKQFGEISFDCIFEDEGIETKPFKVYVVATERFTKNHSVSPRLCIPITAYNSSLLKNGELKYQIVNVGNDTLFVRKIQFSNSGIKAVLDKDYCLPNDTCHLIVNKIASCKTIEDDITIGITTNDRIEPFRQLRIIASH